MKITTNCVAALDYRLTDDGGHLLDTSDGRGPLAYVHGSGSILPALEKKLEGKESGASFQVRIPPEEAYGARDEDMVQTVQRSELPPGIDPQVGMQLQARSEAGRHILTVIGVEEDSVRLDANHPLAGKALNFDVTVVEVRAATQDEIQHGHVHGPGGHHH